MVRSSSDCTRSLLLYINIAINMSLRSTKSYSGEEPDAASPVENKYLLAPWEMEVASDESADERPMNPRPVKRTRVFKELPQGGSSTLTDCSI
jgi:hypothetical protein